MAAVTGMLSPQFMGQVHAASEQVYQDIRIYSGGGFTETQQVEIPDSELDYLTNWQNNQNNGGHGHGIQSFSDDPLTADGFDVTMMRDSGLSHEDSIVIVLFGDAFTEAQYGTWPNPATGTVLWHADAVINTMFGTHPYDDFEHLLTVYLIHTFGENQVAGENGYLGTVDASGELSSGTTWQSRIAELASLLVEDANHINMIQVIANSVTLNGFAFVNPPPLFPVRISVASIIRAGTSLGKPAGMPSGGICVCSNYPNCTSIPTGTLWHNIIIHEFGHSFGNLSDERAAGLQTNNAIANVTNEANNNNVKWAHWYGHRLVTNPPMRFSGWAVPRGDGCIMRGGGGTTCIGTEFCGVCAAQMTCPRKLVQKKC